MLGGTSAERPVSLNSGAAVLAALQRQGIDAHAFDPANRNLGDLISGEFDRVFIALHGRLGEDGCMQGALELLGMPYTGSGVMASALGMDKWRTKLLWRAAGLPTADWAMLSADSDFAAVEKQLGLPIFVKPAREGSSIGMSKVTEAGTLKAAYETAAEHDPLVLAETFIDGAEFTVGILGDRALPLIRLEPAKDKAFYDFEAKYLRNDTPVPLPGRPARRRRTGLAPACAGRIPPGGRTRMGTRGCDARQPRQSLFAGSEYLARHDRSQPGADGSAGGWTGF